MDAVSDRDFLLDLHSASAVCMMHVSRLAEELVLWSSSEFGFVRMDDRFTTGSSIMPQKRNPDFAEIARGKSGRAYGNLMALLTVLKGLPLTYNRDMQEDKEGLFDTVDSVQATLRVMAGVVSSMQHRRSHGWSRPLWGSYSLATDIADYLVAKGHSRSGRPMASYRGCPPTQLEHGKAFRRAFARRVSPVLGPVRRGRQGDHRRVVDRRQRRTWRDGIREGPHGDIGRQGSTGG